MMKTAEYWLARDEGHRHGFLGKPALPNPPEGYARGYKAGRLRYDALLDGWECPYLIEVQGDAYHEKEQADALSPEGSDERTQWRDHSGRLQDAHCFYALQGADPS